MSDFYKVKDAIVEKIIKSFVLTFIRFILLLIYSTKIIKFWIVLLHVKIW